MADIRLTQPRTGRLWLWVGILSALGLALWASAFVVGDATEASESRRVGAALDIGENRTPVLPAQAVPFSAVQHIDARDLGRLVHVSGTAESRLRQNSVWVRTGGGRRILLRFEPAPPENALGGIGPGSAIRANGYLSKISRAEFEVWMDTLGVRLPKPPPGRKFGDLPDPGFARIDSLFLKTYYISVRPEGIGAEPPAQPEPEAERTT